MRNRDYTADDFRDECLVDHEWATRYRIPLLPSGAYPRWSYEVALSVPDSTVDPSYSYLRDLVWPTEEEAALVSRVIDFRRSWYREEYRQVMLRSFLDVDSGTNTLVLAKLASGWRFRRVSWQGQLWNHEPYGELMDLLDAEFNLTDRWSRFKLESGLSPQEA